MNKYSVVYITCESKDASMYESPYKIFTGESMQSLLTELLPILPDNVISLKIHKIE